MKRRNGIWFVAAALASSLLVGLISPLAHASSSAATGLPLYQFSKTSSGPLPWNASSLNATVDGTTMVDGPHSATSSNGTTAVAYRTTAGGIDVLEYLPAGTTLFLPLSAAFPSAGADPIPFFDPRNNLHVVYVSTTGALEVLSPSSPPVANYFHYSTNRWAPWTLSDLSAATNVTFASGLASVQVTSSGAEIDARATNNDVEILTLAWPATGAVPTLASAAFNATTATSTTTATSDPVSLSLPAQSFVTTSSAGHVMFYYVATQTNAWAEQDLTSATGGPTVSGPLTAGVLNGVLYVAGLTAGGHVALYTTGNTGVQNSSTSSSAVDGFTWSSVDITAATTNAPPLGGALFLSTGSSQVSIAGKASNWGDLFILSNAGAGTSWSATDVSATGGSAAQTVGDVVTGAVINNALTLFAGGVDSPPPTGTGLYAIPSAKWSQSIHDGWRVLGDTGGLGTQSAPWVGFTSATNVAQSPDYLMGQAIATSHTRVTWLSFWTISGPPASSKPTTASFYSHGFAAGAWVATQIDAYRGLGLGLKPDWVILDPEGYPDLHSGLDAPSGSSKAVQAVYATYWSAMLQGWAAGLASVDPSLNAGFYASQSEYRNYGLSSQPLADFMALAFGNGGPIPVAGASGSNVRGYIAFGSTCTPNSSQPLTVSAQQSTLLNPPWSGSFNTLQFNSGVYCAP